ncbi:MAG TPA: CAP domain-containing protein [Polyangiaceae bacterium]|jgi:hypothetical protein
MRARSTRGLAAAAAAVALAASTPCHGGEPASPSWASWTSSPTRVDAASLGPLERAAQEACGTGESGLRATARALVERKTRGLPLPDVDAIESLERAAGEPHPWPRVWAATAATLDAESTLQKLSTWLASQSDRPSRRCGVAEAAASDGRRTLVVVAVQALADLQPLPTRARAGQWLDVAAQLSLGHATGGRVVVLGPSGAARTLPSWFDHGALHARFAADGPGETLVQVVADLPGGPRPVLEASVFTDVEPSLPDGDRPVPGEDVGAGLPDADRLAAMITQARTLAGLPALFRDRHLDDVAREHAERMASTRTLAHDAGDGDPLERLRVAGVPFRAAGENVAHAGTVPLAHRALWGSPSHRANVLGAYTRLGVGVVRDENGDAWVVEEMAR